MLSLENAVYQIVGFYALLARCHFCVGDPLVVLVAAEKNNQKRCSAAIWEHLPKCASYVICIRSHHDRHGCRHTIECLELPLACSGFFNRLPDEHAIHCRFLPPG